MEYVVKLLDRMPWLIINRFYEIINSAKNRIKRLKLLKISNTQISSQSQTVSFGFHAFLRGPIPCPNHQINRNRGYPLTNMFCHEVKMIFHEAHYEEVSVIVTLKNIKLTRYWLEQGIKVLTRHVMIFRPTGILWRMPWVEVKRGRRNFRRCFPQNCSIFVPYHGAFFKVFFEI